VATASLLASACSDDTSDDARSTDPAEFAAESLDEVNDTPPIGADTSSTTEPVALDPADIPGDPINKFNLRTGDCFELIDDLEEGRPVTRTTRLPCEDPHGFEIFHELLYPAEHPSIYPGEGTVRQFALESCYREFGPWVGQEYELSALEIDVIIPPRENFENDAARYRGIHCWVERVDGEPMIGSSRGSGW
jgi:hypothetical protein